MKTCCQHHADKLPDGCYQGRLCPERIRRAEEAEARRQAERRIASDPVGVECALPIVADDLRPLSFWRRLRLAFGG